MKITPLILGSGRSGDALAKSFLTIAHLDPELGLDNPVQLTRGASLTELKKQYEHPVLAIANPHGLHADAILEAGRAGFEAIVSEKPSCVNLDQVKALEAVKTPTAVLHVYRLHWGPQTIKQMLAQGELGELITIEGRYWQSSTAERALKGSTPETKKSWKNDTRLSGEYDTYLDIGSHWVDMVSFLFGATPTRIEGWRSYANAETPHRDSHIQLSLSFPGHGRAFGSISKTFHGATNHFEINLVGSKKSATWKFLQPDEIFIGEGRDQSVITRKDSELGSKQPPHHAMGWLEGYIEITHRLLADVFQKRASDYPTLKNNLALMKAMLAAEWKS